MTRDQAQPGATVTWTAPGGGTQSGTVLAEPLDRTDQALIAWEDQRDGRRYVRHLPIASLRLVTEVRP
jgi:hypothetical protein